MNRREIHLEQEGTLSLVSVPGTRFAKLVHETAGVLANDLPVRPEGYCAHPKLAAWNFAKGLGAKAPKFLQCQPCDDAGGIYDGASDSIVTFLPKIGGDESARVWFHEIVHSTGHGKRLDRPAICQPAASDKPGEPAVLWAGDYDPEDLPICSEEFTAEFGALLVADRLNIDLGRTCNRQSWFAWAVKLDAHGTTFVRGAIEDARAACEYLFARPA